MKISAMIGMLLCSAGIAIAQDAVELPFGKTNLLDIGWFDIGYQSYGKEPRLLPKGTVEDMMGETGIANKLMADEYFDGDEKEAQLQQAIASLPEVQRTVFLLRYYDDMKYSDISKTLGTSEGALKASYHIAVKKITEFFKQFD